MQGYRVASIYRPDTGEVVQLNNIVQEGTAYRGQRHEDGPESPHGGRYDAGQRHELTLRFVGHAEGAQLIAWFQQGVAVRCVAIAAVPNGRNLQWYETTRMTYCRPVEVQGAAKGRGDVYEVKLVHEHPRAAVYARTNLLAPAPWGDVSPTNGIADDWILSGSGSFTSGVQTLTVPVSGVIYFRQVVELPISGLALTFSQAVYAYTATAGTAQMDLGGETFGAAPLIVGATTFASLGTLPATGTVAYVTPSGLYRITAMSVRVLSTTGAGQVQVAYPFLRADGQTAYTQF